MPSVPLSVRQLVIKRAKEIAKPKRKSLSELKLTISSQNMMAERMNLATFVSLVLPAMVQNLFVNAMLTQKQKK